MKKLLALLILTSTLSYAQEFKFEKEVIDYGKIKRGDNGIKVFEFTNIGNAPIIIKSVKSSCGCTIPEKPKKPIMPNEKGAISVSYDTKRIGSFSKAITIISNAKIERKKLIIKGSVSK